MEKYNVYHFETYRMDTNGIDKLIDPHAVAVKQTPVSNFATDVKELSKVYSSSFYRVDWSFPNPWRNVTKEEICSRYDNVEFIGEYI